MNHLLRLMFLSFTLTVVGCGHQQADESTSDAPLTMEQWKALPSQTRYEIETLERLKQGTPKLQNQREWDRFTREELLPMKNKEMPRERGKH
jgi:hypothetical protein